MPRGSRRGRDKGGGVRRTRRLRRRKRSRRQEVEGEQLRSKVVLWGVA